MSSAVPREMLEKMRRLRADLAKLDAEIAHDEMPGHMNARDKLVAQLNAVEHEINCEIIRGAHLICA